MALMSVNGLKNQSGSIGSTTLDVYFVDVGRGNCVIVKFPNDTWMLVDAGTLSSLPGSTTILKSINAIVGNNTFATVVLTHPDLDHNNLVPSIKQAAKPDNVFIGGITSQYDGEVVKWFNKVTGNKGNVFTFKNNHYFNPIKEFNPGTGCNVYVLAANVKGNPNDGSVVLGIDYGSTTAILTGDATAITERAMMKEWSQNALLTNLLSFGHHGSDHSSSDAFLKIVKANVGTFSADAAHMGYGHPRCDVLDLVEKMVDVNGQGGKIIPKHRHDCWRKNLHLYVTEENDLAVYLTATQGNTKFTTDGKQYEVWVDRLK